MEIQPTDEPAEASPAAAPQTLPYAMPAEAEAPSERMTRGDVACLTFKVIGLYVIVQSLPLMVNFLNYIHGTFSDVLGAAVPFVLTAGLGAALIIWSRAFARWMLPRTAVVASEPPGHGPAQFQAIAFSILGVYFCASAIPSLVYLLTRIIGEGASSGTASPISRAQGLLPSLLHYGVQILLGIWLFFGSKRLSSWWWQMRHPELRYAQEEAPLQTERIEP